MLELLNTRISSGDEATLGTLFDVTEEPKFLCYVLEDQFNEPKIPGETRIPAGRYEIEFRDEGGMVKRYKKRFDWHGGMLWLQDVPDFQFIYIHVGNKDDDTDGCLLVGDGQVSNVIERGTVTTSVAAYRRLYEKIEAELDAAEAVWITLEDYA
jgi:hypothetical protein